MFENFFKRYRKSPSPTLPTFFNTLSKHTEQFDLPPHAHTVRMYNCGPTVYGTQHIGNLSMFVFTDVVRHILEYNGFAVKQVINITDFGHLSGDNMGDADTGEDRMTKGLKREGMKVSMENMRTLGERYTQIFFEDIQKLHIDTTRIEFPRASMYIKAQIAMIETLVEKGYAYQTAGGVYYDTTQFADYGRLGAINLEGLQEGARVTTNKEKRNPFDFVLWKSDKKIGWDSPWGLGFPGWHIECSAMIRATLGQQIDIHTGGIEHIPIHHNNEIAQSEAATGKKPLSRFWIHRAHIQIDGGKIAKSAGTAIFLSDVLERGYHPLALRYLFLGAHYRTSANFSWKALDAAQTAFAKLVAIGLHFHDIKPSEPPQLWKARFLERINDDVDTPGALAVVWEMVKDKSLQPEALLAGLYDFDRVLGLGLTQPDEAAQTLARNELKEEVPLSETQSEVRQLFAKREIARKGRSWAAADKLRSQIEALGFTVEDSSTETRIFKK